MPTALLLAACLTDIKYKKVLNLFVVAGLICVFSVHLIFGTRETMMEGVFGLGMAFVLTLPLFMLKAMSSGDLKIFALFGLTTNVDAVLFTFIASMVWGGLLGIIRALFNKQGDVLWSNFVKVIKMQKPERHTLHQIPFSVALLAGWISYIIFNGYGRVL